MPHAWELLVIMVRVLSHPQPPDDGLSCRPSRTVWWASEFLPGSNFFGSASEFAVRTAPHEQ